MELFDRSRNSPRKFHQIRYSRSIEPVLSFLLCVTDTYRQRWNTSILLCAGSDESFVTLWEDRRLISTVFRRTVVTGQYPVSHRRNVDQIAGHSVRTFLGFSCRGMFLGAHWFDNANFNRWISLNGEWANLIYGAPLSIRTTTLSSQRASHCYIAQPVLIIPAK
jgi:hypothetical protein